MKAVKAAAEQKPKMISCRRDVHAGPERAALLGVPVGTIIDSVETRWYRNPLRRFWWQLTHPQSGRINPEGSVS